jgi:TPP-dependent pyruvate/acetoin dehydrogenase alpha subunit
MEAEPDRDQLAWMYRQMLRIREFEERVKATFTEHPGVIRGHTHLADGAEAKARAFSMPRVAVDGGDPVLVRDAVGAAVGRARSGEGPWLVESKIYRLPNLWSLEGSRRSSRGYGGTMTSAVLRTAGSPCSVRASSRVRIC